MAYGKEQFQGYMPVTVSAKMKTSMLFANTVEREAKLCLGSGAESLLVILINSRLKVKNFVLRVLRSFVARK